MEGLYNSSWLNKRVQYRDDLTGPEYKVGVLGGENLNKDIQ